MYEKKTFKTIFIITTVILITLPAITTFNEILTSIVMKIQLYRVIQEFIVPIEAKMIVVTVGLFGIKAIPTPLGLNIGTIQQLNHVTISWNCIGWQSFILFVITLFTGLQGPYTRYSKTQTILIGFLGTFLINITRISLVVLLAQFVNQVTATVFHDYFSTVMTIAWLFFFWWFSFTYVLERKLELYDLLEENPAPPTLRIHKS
ncbi:MAG: exosortase/archaeosortase family protein, partial [Candidatus Levybacteria bacterium]|nr:exosortase/archaeosortase family protein [Candidatus Levybacteria bacterium]